jgi:hypothetical protein
MLVRLSKYNYLRRKKRTNKKSFIFDNKSLLYLIPESCLFIFATLNVELAPSSVKSVRTLKHLKIIVEKKCNNHHYDTQLEHNMNANLPYSASYRVIV